MKRNRLCFSRLSIEPQSTSTPLSVRIAGWIIEIFPRLMGALFVFTAIQKIRQPAPLHDVFEFDGLPVSLVSPAAWSVVVVELLIGGLMLLFLKFRRMLLLATAVLLIIYIAQLGYLLLYDQAPSCGCLGTEAEPNETRITNLLSLVRNVCLLWPVIWTWLQLSPARETL